MNDDTMAIIGAMNDYADKQNNSGLKNIILAALITVLGTIAVGVIGYLAKELYNLRTEKEALKTQVIRLEMRYDATVEEQNRVVFQMLQSMEMVTKRAPTPKSDDDTSDPDDDPIVKPFVPDSRKGFQRYHDSFKQRIQDRLPPETQQKAKAQ